MVGATARQPRGYGVVVGVDVGVVVVGGGTDVVVGVVVLLVTVGVPSVVVPDEGGEGDGDGRRVRPVPDDSGDVVSAGELRVVLGTCAGVRDERWLGRLPSLVDPSVVIGSVAGRRGRLRSAGVAGGRHGRPITRPTCRNPAETVPRSPTSIGRYAPFAHQLRKSAVAVADPTATRNARVRGRVSVPRQAAPEIPRAARASVNARPTGVSASTAS